MKSPTLPYLVNCTSGNDVCPSETLSQWVELDPIPARIWLNPADLSDREEHWQTHDYTVLTYMGFRIYSGDVYPEAKAALLGWRERIARMNQEELGKLYTCEIGYNPFAEPPTPFPPTVEEIREILLEGFPA